MGRGWAGVKGLETLRLQQLLPRRTSQESWHVLLFCSTKLALQNGRTENERGFGCGLTLQEAWAPF